MMKKRTMFLLGAAASLSLLASGCSSLNLEKLDFFSSKAKEPAPVQTVEVKKVGEKLVHAFVSNKPEEFMKELPEAAAAEFSVNSFNATRKGMIKELGEPVSYEFLTNLKHPTYNISVWIVRFERDKSDKSAVIQQETLFRAISVTKDGKDVLLDFRFQ